MSRSLPCFVREQLLGPDAEVELLVDPRTGEPSCFGFGFGLLWVWLWLALALALALACFGFGLYPSGENRGGRGIVGPFGVKVEWVTVEWVTVEWVTVEWVTAGWVTG